MSGKDVFRMQIPRGDFGFRWSSKGSRLLYQLGDVVHVREVAAATEVQLKAPDRARASSWLANDSKILFAKANDEGQQPQLYIMDADSGRWFEIPLPSDAMISQFESFSPDGKYLAYPIRRGGPGCFYECDLSALEIATGRTCLMAKDAPSHQYPQHVGWSEDSTHATYYAKYDGSWFSEKHAVDVTTCTDTVLDPTPTPTPGTATPRRVHDLVIGVNGKRLTAPSGRYEVIYGHEGAIPTLRPGETPPWAQDKPFLLTPTTGSAQMYVLDNETGEVTTLVDESLEYEPFAWVP